MNLELKTCNINDLNDLRTLSINTYKDTFATMNTVANMTKYLNRAFSINKLKEELMNNASIFFFLYVDNNLAGYLKVNEAIAQTDINDQKSIELERIYVSKNFQGNGCGNFLMESAINLAMNKQKKYIWLGVWEKNTKALKLYKKNGFYKFGQHSFVMGTDKQNDYILRKDL